MWMAQLQSLLFRPLQIPQAWMLLKSKIYSMQIFYTITYIVLLFIKKNKTQTTLVHKPLQCSEKKHSPWQGTFLPGWSEKHCKKTILNPSLHQHPTIRCCWILYAPVSTITHYIVSYLPCFLKHKIQVPQKENIQRKPRQSLGNSVWVEYLSSWSPPRQNDVLPTVDSLIKCRSCNLVLKALEEHRKIKELQVLLKWPPACKQAFLKRWWALWKQETVLGCQQVTLKQMACRQLQTHPNYPSRLCKQPLPLA